MPKLSERARTFILSVLLAASGQASALSLGEIEHLSALEKPLDLRIPLQVDDSSEISDTKASIASVEVYQNSGIDRPAFLDSVSIEIIEKNGQGYVHIYSARPQHEPIFDLILEVTEINGRRFRRNYSVLMDLPAAIPAAALPVALLPSQPAVAPEVAAVAPVRAPLPPLPLPASTGDAAQTYGPVRSGESLGRIAQRVRGDRRLPLAQVMNALYLVNPGAFDGDMGRLLQGTMLKVPDTAGLRAAPSRRPGAATPIAQEQAEAPVETSPSPPAPDVSSSPVLLVRFQLAERLTRLPTAEEVQIASARQDALLASEASAVPAPAASAQAQPAAPPEPAENAVSPPDRESWLLRALPWLIAGLSLLLWLLRNPFARTTAMGSGVQDVSSRAAARPIEQTGPKVTVSLPPASAAPPPAPKPESVKPAGLLSPLEHSILVEETRERTPQQVQAFFLKITNLLEEQLEKDPTRRDLHAKLMEIQFASGSRDRFVEQTRRYLQLLGGRADKNWPAIVKMGQQLAPETGLYTENPAASTMLPQTAAPAPRLSPHENQRHSDNIGGVKLAGLRMELEEAHKRFAADADFQRTFHNHLASTLHRPTRLLHLQKLSTHLCGAQIYRKFENQAGAGETEMINALGQALLAKYVGKPRVVTSTHDGIHGAAVAQAANLLGLECMIYMDAGQESKITPACKKMRALGAHLELVHESSLVPSSDVRQRAIADWLANSDQTFYISGLAAGPSPYPALVQDFQSVVGRETEAQIMQLTGRLPAAVVADASDGYASVGLLLPFLKHPGIRLYCVNAQTRNREKSAFLREHGWLKASGRVVYSDVDDIAGAAATRLAEQQEDWTLHSGASRALAQAQAVAQALTPADALVVMLPPPAGEAGFKLAATSPSAAGRAG